MHCEACGDRQSKNDACSEADKKEQTERGSPDKDRTSARGGIHFLFPSIVFFDSNLARSCLLPAWRETKTMNEEARGQLSSIAYEL
jgi:hypothetical protein